jgi:hypothetical protein
LKRGGWMSEVHDEGGGVFCVVCTERLGVSRQRDGQGLIVRCHHCGGPL